MLENLHIENYALISKLSIEFGPGLNLLTGETGSGKSIVVDALGLLLGGKGSPDLIRAGAERATIVGSFSADPKWEEPAKAMGLPIEGDGMLLKRELQISGKTRAFLNDHPITVGALRALARWLPEIHGQNEQQELYSAAVRLEMLDRVPTKSNNQDSHIISVAAAYTAWRTVGERLAALTRDEQEKLRLTDLWGFQKNEIEAAAPRPGEDAQLEAEKQVLANATRIHAALETAHQQLYEAPGAAASSVAAALKALEEVARFDPLLQPVCDELRSARVTIQEAAFTARGRMERMNANPHRLEQLEERLAALDRLKRKYGPGLAEVSAHLEKITRQLAELESSEELAREAARELETARARYQEAAAKLSARRKETAHRLEKTVQKVLGELAMEGTRFQVEFESTAGKEEDWRPTGTDLIDFLISPNPGEPLRRLEDIASGGELSRLMLALKLSVGDPALGKTMVFDEVDSGIGGRVAETLGRKLKALAASHQVLCVTHLPQIAAFADRHYFVEKHEEGGRTVTSVRLLKESERPAELARMLSGSRITDAVLTHAGEMLKAGKK